jgi:hypothetical protein
LSLGEFKDRKMNFLKMMRFYDSSLPHIYDHECPKCGSILVPSNYEQYYADEPNNKAMEYWCEHDKEIFSLWTSITDVIPIAKAFAVDFIQNSQVLLVNHAPTLFSPALKKLAAYCDICGRDGMPATGNMFYDKKFKKWHVEYWCTYDREVFTVWGADYHQLTLDIAEEALAHGQFNLDL